jgi:hypothetical protein
MEDNKPRVYDMCYRLVRWLLQDGMLMFWYWARTPGCQRPMCLLCTRLMINIKYIATRRPTTIKEMGD